MHDRATIRSAIHDNAAFTVPFVVMNSLATVVACYGLLSNSTAVVIGAMIIAVLLGPISGIALALVDGDSSLLRKALLAECGGALLVLLIAFGIGLVHRNLPLTHEMLARTRPNILDLMIALAGGAAGAYATVSPRVSVGLVGVAIATALVPPLSTCGMCLARMEFGLAWGGFLLFFTNLVAIQFASSLVMWLNGFHAVTDQSEDGRRTRLRILTTNGISFASLCLLTAVMGTNFIRSVEQQQFENAVRDDLEKRLSAFPGVHLADVQFLRRDGSESVIAVVRTPYSFSPERVRQLETVLPPAGDRRVELEVMSVIVKETTRDGYLHESNLSADERNAVPVTPASDTTPSAQTSPAPMPTQGPAEPDTSDTKVFGP